MMVSYTCAINTNGVFNGCSLKKYSSENIFLSSGMVPYMRASYHIIFLFFSSRSFRRFFSCMGHLI